MISAINQSIAEESHFLQKARGASSTIKLQSDDKRLMDACHDFEAIFVKQMLNSMKKTIDKSGLINGGMTEDIFEDWLYDEYAGQISKNGDLGLAQKMFNQIKGISEGYHKIEKALDSHATHLNLKG